MLSNMVADQLAESEVISPTRRHVGGLSFVVFLIRRVNIVAKG